MAGARWLLLAPVVLFVLAWIPLAEPPVAAYPFDYLFDGITGIILVFAGLVAWDRRPANPTGRLLVLAGYLWYVGSLLDIFPPASWVAYVAWVFRGFYDPLIAFVVLSFPRAKLETRADRFAVAALTGVLMTRAVWRMIGTQPGSGIPRQAPTNPLLIVRDIETYLAVDVWLFLALGIALVIVSVMAVRRWLRLPAGAHRVTDPVLAGGALWAFLSGLYAIAEWAHWWLHTDVLPWDGPGWSISYAFRTLAPLGLLIGAWRLRSGTAAVVDLVSAKDGPPRGQGLERSLRRALGDPTIELLYPAGNGSWSDLAGEPRTLPAADDPARAATILETEARPTGAIVHDAALLADPGLVNTVAAVVRLAMDNEQLRADLVEQLDEVRASRTRIVDAADAERQRVERDLHDGAQQRLVALAVSLRTIRVRIGTSLTPEVADELDKASGEVRAAIDELRELARGLDPAILRTAGLRAALESLAARSPVPVELDLVLDGRLPGRAEATAYFVVAESLANVAKHAGATVVRLSAAGTDGHLRLEVADDGAGGADPAGAGLRGLADRVAAVDGILDVVSPPGGGTRVVATIPCGS